MMLSYVSPNSACVFIRSAVSFLSCTIVVSSSSSFFSAKKLHLIKIVDMLGISKVYKAFGCR